MQQNFVTGNMNICQILLVFATIITLYGLLISTHTYIGCAYHKIAKLTEQFHDFSALSKPVYPVKPNSVDSGHCNLSVVQQVHAKHSWTESK